MKDIQIQIQGFWYVVDLEAIAAAHVMDALLGEGHSPSVQTILDLLHSGF